MKRTVPTATYRLQFNGDFTFADAAAIAPYLHTLGISHIYASPCLKARAGSAHGYDIVDHDALNPELGDDASFNAFVDVLHRHGMGLILDIVPNHMGVGGSDNSWWLDVLEHGEASAFSDWFDIDWHPSNSVLRHKLLLPFLADHYGEVLERGELRLTFDAAEGAFYIAYFDHRFPIDPRTYPQIFGSRTGSRCDRGAGIEGPGIAAIAELQALADACRALPRRTIASQPGRRRRRQGGADCKRRLAQLCRQHRGVITWLQDTVADLNGCPGRSHSVDRLHHLLERQAYRLAYWKVAADEINYRRFFDINDLAGLRMDNAEVFRATHSRIADMIAKRRIDGVRVDHIDGLSDPDGYCRALRQLLGASRRAGDAKAEETAGEPYLVVEKILAAYERLPRTWPIDGTTGYEFAALVNGFLLYPDSEGVLTRLYHRFTAADTRNSGADFDERLYGSKKVVMRQALSGELTVLANLLSGIARADRHTRDFTNQRLRDALEEVVACFPVYRTYITPAHTGDDDRQYVDWALAQALKRSPGDKLMFGFIRAMLLPEAATAHIPHIRRQIAAFARRFQQYTAAVAAKGMEDTACYRDYRLACLNDVGFDPRNIGVSVATLHRENRRRLEEWPDTLIATSTHDSKRGEDVRARMAVLSELPTAWRRHVRRWSRLNRGRKRRVKERPAPCRDDEYLLYQTLIGAWPDGPITSTGMDLFRERIAAYLVKAAREAKRRTSWSEPDDDYEQALRDFVGVLLKGDRNRFLADFLPFQRAVSRCGGYNGLTQTLLKLTAPGVPDIYQGNELWAYNLVDPDNRRPVDYERRQALLGILEERVAAGEPAALAGELADRIEDGRAKLYLTWTVLNLRRRYPELFARGDYTGLSTGGERAEHVCAFARRLDNTEMIVVAPRWFALLMGGDRDALPTDKMVWGDTWFDGPVGALSGSYRNVLTGERIAPVQRDARQVFFASELFVHFPVALLLS